jgi:hypothetical protein
MSIPRSRLLLRWLHIGLGSIIGLLLYSPLGASQVFLDLVRFGVFPVVGLTGIAIWQYGRLRRALPTRPVVTR